MATRKVNHNTRIRSKTSTSISTAKFGNIIEFKYRNKDKDNYDKKPLVFVLAKKGKILNGINIGYLKEYIVEQLLEEKSSKNLNSWSLCKKAFRTYKISEINMVKLIEYETRFQRKARLESQFNADGTQTLTEQPDLPEETPKGPGGN